MKNILLFFIMFSFIGCSKKDIPSKSSLKTIYSLQFKSAINPNLTNDIVGIISNDSIILNVGANTNVSSLIPTISFGGIGLTPNTGIAQNYSSGINYTVTAEDGSQKNYKTYLNILSAAKSITSFIFKTSDNNALSADITGIITGDSIGFLIPAGIPLNSLVPSITYVGKAISPTSETANDFSYPVKYEVTADDGSKRNYTVFVSANKDIYIHGDDGYVYDVNAITGAVKWKVNTGGNGVPTYHNGLVFVNGYADFKNLIYALNAADGTVVWTTIPPPGNYTLTMPAVKYGKLYFAGSGLLNYTGSNYAYYAGFILSLNEQTGSVEWIKPYITSTGTGANILNTNVTIGDNMAIVYDIYTGLFAYDAVTGDALWNRSGDMLGRANPIILNNMIVFGIEGGLRAVNETNGTEIWNIINSANFGSPTSSTTNIYSATPGLAGLNVDGSPLWPIPGSDGASTIFSPFYYNGMLLMNGNGNVLIAYSASNGIPIWTRDHYTKYPVAANNEIFICDDQYQLNCLDAKTGKTKWVNTAVKTFSQPLCLVDVQNMAYHVTESGE